MESKDIIKEPMSDVVIRFQDCDPFGHLNNARYIDYFINAREDHLSEHYDFDIYERQKQSNSNWVVAKTKIAYIFPLTQESKKLSVCKENNITKRFSGMLKAASAETWCFASKASNIV